MDQGLLAMIISAILALLGAFTGAHKYIGKFFKAMKESTEVFVVVDKVIDLSQKALDNNIVDESEIVAIKAQLAAAKIELAQAKEAWKDLFGE